MQSSAAGLETILKGIARRFPRRYHPQLRKAYEVQGELASSATTLKRPRTGRRVVFRDHEIADVEGHVWRGPGPNEAGIDVLFSAISVGTESAVLLGLPNAVRSMPFHPGYSGSGIVTAVGRRARGIRPGDLVAGQIGHGSYAVVNTSRLVKFEGVEFAPAMAFVELGCIVQQAARKAKIGLGEHVAIVGAGLLGQMAAMYVNSMGAGRITLVGRRRRGDGVIAGLPFPNEYVAAAGADAPEVAELAADVAIEAAGTASGLAVAVEAVRRGGRVVNLGSTREYVDAADLMKRLLRKETSMVGAHISTIDLSEGSPDVWTHAEERELFSRLVMDGTFEPPPHEIVTASREDVNALYESMIRRRDNPTAVLLAWGRN